MSARFSTTVAARRLGVPPWQVRRLYENKLLPDTDRVGQQRVIDEDDLPTIERALIARGYLKSETPAMAS